MPVRYCSGHDTVDTMKAKIFHYHEDHEGLHAYPWLVHVFVSDISTHPRRQQAKEAEAKAGAKTKSLGKKAPGTGRQLGVALVTCGHHMTPPLLINPGNEGR